MLEVVLRSVTLQPNIDTAIQLFAPRNLFQNSYRVQTGAELNLLMYHGLIPQRPCEEQLSATELYCPTDNGDTIH